LLSIAKIVLNSNISEMENVKTLNMSWKGKYIVLKDLMEKEATSCESKSINLPPEVLPIPAEQDVEKLSSLLEEKDKKMPKKKEKTMKHFLKSYSFEERTNGLSKEQIEAFDLFKRGENIFITGPAGTGKTKLIREFLDYSNSMNNTIQICAMTGCAALLLNCNAKTLHSWSGIKLARGTKDSIVISVLRNRNVKNLWKKTKILVIDEVSMLSQKIFEILNEIGKCIKNRMDLPFGGMQVIFTGDFYQLPPVGNMEEPETSAFCFESPEWLSVFPLKNHVELKTIFRQNDPIYVKILSEIRVGELSEESKETLKKYVKREKTSEEIENNFVATKLFPLRKRTEYVNNEMFSKINEDVYEFHYHINRSNTTFIHTNELIDSDVINHYNKLPEKEIEKIADSYISNIPCGKIVSLKKGAAVMCVINLDMDIGISNGSQGVIIDFIEKEEDATPIVKFYNGIVRPIPYYYWQIEDTPTISIGQIPLILSWAMTIHKMQGATISRAEIDIGNSVFEYGQIYVALSRLKSLDGLFILSFNPYKIKANPIVMDFYKSFSK
jgi:ATP-dependent DNA helicase PIF1